MFSTTTSAVRTRWWSTSMPSGHLRSRTRLRLLRCRFWKSDVCRFVSNVDTPFLGASTRMTSAPQSASWRTHVGPARAIVRSMTRMSLRAWDTWRSFARHNHGPMAGLLIKGGTVVDGTGAHPVRADVRVDGATIVEVATDLRPGDGQVVDADGAFVTPGFIDVHTHLDPSL